MDIENFHCYLHFLVLHLVGGAFLYCGHISLLCDLSHNLHKLGVVSSCKNPCFI